MAVFMLRDVPADVYDPLKGKARRSGRSLAAVAREARRTYAREIDRRQRLQSALGAMGRQYDRRLERRSGWTTSDRTTLLRKGRER